jgi:hypothetical protein
MGPSDSSGLSRPGRLSLNATFQAEFLPVVTAFVEQSCLALGLGRQEALKLTLASEEIFAYLCGATRTADPLEVICSGGLYYGAVEFSFPRKEFNLRALNLTTRVSADREEEWAEMGLLIAARSVDRLQVLDGEGGRLTLRLTREKAYPSDDGLTAPESAPGGPLTVRTASAEEVKAFIRLLNLHYEKVYFPPAFRFPGKAADMVASGDCAAVVAVDARGRLGGGLVWKEGDGKTVECFGPYLFGLPEPETSAAALLDAFLEKVARTRATGCLSRYGSRALPRGYFDALGTVTYRRGDGSILERPASYRHLFEDTGASAWASEALRPFLEAEYGRLFLPRTLHPARYEGEALPTFSVFATEFDKDLEQVTLRPLWPGQDAPENLERHLQVFREEGFVNIFFELDLGVPWQGRMGNLLCERGFRPRLILPEGGQADVVVFQHQEGTP